MKDSTDLEKHKLQEGNGVEIESDEWYNLMGERNQILQKIKVRYKGFIGEWYFSSSSDRDINEYMAIPKDANLDSYDPVIIEVDTTDRGTMTEEEFENFIASIKQQIKDAIDKELEESGGSKVGGYRQVCPMCKRTFTITDVNLSDIRAYKNGSGMIQSSFAKLNPMEREFIKTGYCPDCQKKIFDTDYTSDRIQLLKEGKLLEDVNVSNALDFVKTVDKMKEIGIWDGKDETFSDAMNKLKEIQDVQKELGKDNIFEDKKIVEDDEKSLIEYVNTSTTNTVILGIIDEFKKLAEKVGVKPEDLHNNGEILYMNANDGTNFDWKCNDRTCEFMMFYKSTDMGFAKLSVEKDGRLSGYYWLDEGKGEGQKIEIPNFVVEPDEFAIICYEQADCCGIYDGPIIDINWDAPIEHKYYDWLYDYDDEDDWIEEDEEDEDYIDEY